MAIGGITNEQLTIRRSLCLSLNEMARVICEGG